jgi:DNA invertase Pin-like site-specific DNA recombinase
MSRKPTATETDKPVLLIGLIRVSTDRQTESGLGLEGQTADIEAFRRHRAGTLLKTYVENESGMHADIESRPQLKAAVAHAKRAGATLVIAKIDRLVRSTVVMSYIKSSGVKFAACDNPYANELTIDILVAVAANEGRQISDRTTKALKAYKEGKHISKRTKLLYPNGVPADVVEATAGKLGAELPQCRNFSDAGRVKGLARSVTVRKAKAITEYADVLPMMQELRTEGHSLDFIAERLNSEGQKTRNQSNWSATQVMRVLNRAKKA